MATFLNLLINGIVTGGVYALLALGFVLIYKASDVINFAQGELLLVGAYVLFALVTDRARTSGAVRWAPVAAVAIAVAVLGAILLIRFSGLRGRKLIVIGLLLGVVGGGITAIFDRNGLPWGLALTLTLCFAVALGVLIERLVLRPLIGEPIISVIMVTIGLSSVLRAIVQTIWGTAPQSLPLPSFLSSEAVQIGSAVVSNVRLTSLGLALVLLLLFTLFFRYSATGIAMRAAADDQQAALSVGISVKRVFAIAWAVSAIVATIGGMMLGYIAGGVSINLSAIGLKVFPVVILGGLDSIPGAIVGGLMIGVIESLASFYIDGSPWLKNPYFDVSGTGEILPFIVLVLVLMVKPYGLFGREIIERV